MEDGVLNQTFMRVCDPEVARLLADVKVLEVLEPFMMRERSLSEVAEELNLKLPTLLYRVNKFLELGLLEVVREVPRRGRAIKMYRTPHDAFFVPFHLTPSETLERLVADLTLPGEAVFHRETARVLQELAPVWGLHVTCGSDGRVALRLTPNEQGYTEAFKEAFLGAQTPAVFAGDGILHLDVATAKDFQRELVDLHMRYAERQTSNGQKYAYRLGLTPIRDK